MSYSTKPGLGATGLELDDPDLVTLALYLVALLHHWVRVTIQRS